MCVIIPIINRFLHWLVIGIISPVLVLLLLSKSISIENVGIFMAIMSVSAVAFELQSGVLSDIFGRYLFSILLQIAGYMIVLWTDTFIGLTNGFYLSGTARAFSSGPIESNYIDAYIDTHGKERLHTLISAMYVAESKWRTVCQVRFPPVRRMSRAFVPCRNAC
ncbi:MAG: hypothetical protein SAMD01599839_02840 [Rectinema sp.]